MSDAQQAATAATSSLQPEEVSVAVLYPGNRIDVMRRPLKESRLDVAIEPSDPYNHDLVICDNADRDLGKEVIKNRITDSALIYRMRGDVFHELDLWDMHIAKEWVAKRAVLPGVDGCLAVTDRLARRFQSETGIDAVGTAGVWKNIDNWPHVDHTDEEPRALTLTNTNYLEKVRPIASWAPVVEAVLEETGGVWKVCGDGENSDTLARWLREYDHVQFVGYVNAKRQLARSNLMLHPSGLDGLPNSILEGMASNLPVLTNDFAAFTEYGRPLVICRNSRELQATLREYADPWEREVAGERGRRQVRREHSPAAVAKEYEEFALKVVRDGSH